MELVQIFFIYFNKISITTNFLAFFVFFSSWTQAVKLIRIHADPDLQPCLSR